MNVLLIGSGGREHALAVKLADSPVLKTLFCAPGNPGIAEVAQCVTINVADHKTVVDFCRVNGVDLVVVGPEAPLVDGLADSLTDAGIPVFGPSAKAAQLEGSKGFTKALCDRMDIPTAAYGKFNNAPKAKAYIRSQGAPIVIKADGLAAGKGVTVAMTLEEAFAAIDDCFEGAFGDAGAEVVVEEFLEGEEASFFCLCDGDNRPAADDGAGPQARRRRRQRTEHRRHGRLFTGLDHDGRADRRDDGEYHRTDDARHGRPGHAVHAACSMPG